MKRKRGLKIILVCALLAILTSAYLLYAHYSSNESFCDISQSISCDIVNRSLYSEIFGIPVSLMGIITFVIVTALSVSSLKNYRLFGLSVKEQISLIFFLMMLSILFMFYLIYIEAFVLYSICLFCTLLDMFIIIIFIVSLKIKQELK